MKIAIILFSLTLALPSFAKDGGVSFGIIGGQSSAEQKHINTLRTRSNMAAEGISTGDLTNAWEFGAFLQFASSMWAFQLRPAYFTQSEDGTASNGDVYEYSVTGYSVTGLFKLYPLQSNELRLFFQAGVAWGNLEVDIQENDFKATAAGSNLGYQIGIGLEMMFGIHSIFLEGNWRFLPIERNIVTSTTGTPRDDSATQYGKDKELEFDDRDLSTSMTGMQLLVGYALNF